MEIQKQQQRRGQDNREFQTEELAADLWDALTTDEKQPLAEWLAAQTSGGHPHVIVEGHASLPDASDMLDANTVFFRQQTGGKAATTSLRLPSRCHAETIFTLSQQGLHGRIQLPEAESAARELKQLLDIRLAAMVSQANHLAGSRTSDEKKMADVAGLLQHWMIHGKPSTSVARH